MNLSPRDLVSVRPVCTGFNALASKPRIRNAAKENLLGLPNPATYNGEPMSDSKFAMIVFTTSVRTIVVSAYTQLIPTHSRGSRTSTTQAITSGSDSMKRHGKRGRLRSSSSALEPFWPASRAD